VTVLAEARAPRQQAVLRSRGFAVLVLALAAAAQLVALQLVLKTPLSGDDSPNQNLKGYIAEHHTGFWDFWWSLVTSEIPTFGRFTPLGLLQTYGLHEVLHDRVAYKLLIVALSVVALLLVAAVLLAQHVPVGVAALATGGAAALFQLHNSHHSLQAYAGLMQLVVIWYCVSVLWFIAWLRRGGWWRLALSVACVLAACLTYEAAYPLVALHFAVALGERGNLKAALRACAVPVGVSLAFIVVVLYLRSAKLQGNTGYSVSTDPGRIMTAPAAALGSVPSGQLARRPRSADAAAGLLVHAQAPRHRDRVVPRAYALGRRDRGA
jgi:preprotein translocase subunit SecG